MRWTGNMTRMGGIRNPEVKTPWDTNVRTILKEILKNRVGGCGLESSG
jgi:hypothetical protein